MTKQLQMTREHFDKVCDALWTEIQYQDNLARRTDDEAKDIPGFLTLARRYERKVEEHWADNPGVEKALHGLRKVAAIYVRSMMYCGIRGRE